MSNYPKPVKKDYVVVADFVNPVDCDPIFCISVLEFYAYKIQVRDDVLLTWYHFRHHLHAVAFRDYLRSLEQTATLASNTYL